MSLKSSFLTTRFNKSPLLSSSSSSFAAVGGAGATPSGLRAGLLVRLELDLVSFSLFSLLFFDFFDDDDL